MNKSSTKSRKSEIYEYIKDNTEKYLTAFAFDLIGVDASTLSLDLHLDRANISRILNTLYKEGAVIKIQGRPTLFVAKSPIQKITKTDYIPNTIEKGESLKQYIIKEDKEFNKRASKLYNYIGSGKNESMYTAIRQIRSAISYPPKGINILLQGAKYTDKFHISRLIFEQYCDLYNLTHSSYYYINCYNHTLSSFIEELNTKKEILKSKIVILTNIDNLAKENIERFQVIVSHLLTDHPQNSKHNKPFLVATSNIIFDGNNLSQLKSLFPTIINLPNFDDKTLKEKIEHIFNIFQKLATEINYTITVEKNIMNSFVISKYETNLQNLTNEIKFSISNAFMRCNTNGIIKIEFEDISDDILNKISTVSNYLPELNSIYSVLDTSNFFFIPNSECKALTTLKNCQLNENHTIDIYKSDLNIPKKIMDTCSLDISKSSSLKINLIYSKLIKQLYDIIYPYVNDLSISKNEKIFYGLLQHISKTIIDIQRKEYNPDYEMENNNHPNINYLNISKQIIKRLNSEINIILPILENEYIAFYLELSEKYINNKEVVVLALCYGDDIAKNYARYVNTLGNRTLVHSLDYSLEYQKGNFNEFQKIINLKVKEIDKGHGVIIASDIEPLTSLDNTIYSQTGIRTLTLSPISLPLLLDIMNIGNKSTSSLDDFKPLNNKITKNINEPYFIKQELAKDKIVETLEEKILSESLIFLDPKKAGTLLFRVLLNILKELELNYTSEIVVKFIIHGCFAIERSIKKEPIKYKHFNTFIREHNKEYLTVEKEFVIVNNTFGTNVPSSELAIITQIFVDYKYNDFI